MHRWQSADAREVYAVKQQRQFLLRDLDRHGIARWPPISAFLQPLVPNREVVFIKPLFRMLLIDRENTVWNALSWGVPAQNAAAP
jgi:hypothetical protein